MSRDSITITITARAISPEVIEARPGDTVEFIPDGEAPPTSVTVSVKDDGRGAMEVPTKPTGGKDFPGDTSLFGAIYNVPSTQTVLATRGSYTLTAGPGVVATLNVVPEVVSRVDEHRVAPAPGATPAADGAPRRLALLIGIDRYERSEFNLHGCVNDIEAIEAILLDRLGVPAANVRKLASRRADSSRVLRVLPEMLPTRANIIAELVKLASEARPGDIVLIYYSGHGTHATAAGGSVTVEAMVPMSGACLYDFELNPLFESIAATGADLTVVLDCCHSAGVSRDVALRKRSIEHDGPLSVEVPSGRRGLRDAGSSEMVVVAACQSHETAYEDPAGKPPHGVLTNALLGAFAKVDDLNSLCWAEVWEKVRADVVTLKPTQSPLLMGRSERKVFGGAWTKQSRGWPVLREGDKCTIRAGTMVGITKGATLAVYSGETQIGELCVSSAELASSVAVLSEGQAKDFPESGARARLSKAVENEKLVVQLDPWDDALAEDLEKRAGVRVTKVGVKEPLPECFIGTSKDGKRLWIGDEVHGERPGAELPLAYVNYYVDIDDREKALKALEAGVRHFEAYNQVLRLSTRCPDLTGQLKLRLLDCSDSKAVAALEGVALHAPALPELERDPENLYTYRVPFHTSANPEIQAGTQESKPWCAVVENSSNQRLRVTLFDVCSDGSVTQLAKSVLVGSGKTEALWYEKLGTPSYFYVPDGRASTVERVIAVGTTDEDAAFDGLVLDDTFEVSIAAGKRRIRPSKEGIPGDLWTAAMVTLKSSGASS